MLEQRLGRAAHLAIGGSERLGRRTQVGVVLSIVIEQKRAQKVGGTRVQAVASGRRAEGVEAQGRPPHDARVLTLGRAQGGHGLPHRQIPLPQAHLLADAAYQGAGRGDAFRQVGIGDSDGLQRGPLEGDEPQKHLAVAAHKRALDVVPALTIAGKHPFHHLLQCAQRCPVVGDGAYGQTLNGGSRDPCDGEERRAHGVLVGGRQNEVDQVVALPLGGIVVEQVHEVGDDPFHIAPLVEEHGHAPRSRSLHHRGRQLLQHHGLHGHRRHAALDERKQRLFGQIGVHAGETQRGEHEFALG